MHWTCWPFHPLLFSPSLSSVFFSHLASFLHPVVLPLFPQLMQKHPGSTQIGIINAVFSLFLCRFPHQSFIPHTTWLHSTTRSIQRFSSKLREEEVSFLLREEELGLLYSSLSHLSVRESTFSLSPGQRTILSIQILFTPYQPLGKQSLANSLFSLVSRSS